MTGLLLAAVSLLPAAAAAGGIVWDPAFGRDVLWNDGQAEVSYYDAVDLRYGKPRTSRAVLIVVAEDFDRERLVKADRPAGEPNTLRVLKLNHVRSVQTGVYTYQQMLSLFLAADRLTPIKLSVASHEWCGNSFVEWRSDRNVLSLRSYFEKTADQDLAFPIGEALFYDELPLKVRSLDFSKTSSGTFTVIDSLFSNSPTPPGSRSARLTASRGEKGGYRVEVTRGSDRDVFDLEGGFPHRLRRWERADGGRIDLIDSRRFRYWEKNRPGDESLLPAPPAR